ncbi:MAG: hypothetical protein ACKO0Z_07000 [Betaproteobacteria bacterium]
MMYSRGVQLSFTECTDSGIVKQSFGPYIVKNDGFDPAHYYRVYQNYRKDKQSIEGFVDFLVEHNEISDARASHGIINMTNEGVQDEVWYGFDPSINPRAASHHAAERVDNRVLRQG